MGLHKKLLNIMQRISRPSDGLTICLRAMSDATSALKLDSAQEAVKLQNEALRALHIGMMLLLEKEEPKAN